MSEGVSPVQAAVPSVDRLMRLPPVQTLVATYGCSSVADAVRRSLALLRETLTLRGEDALPEASEGAILARLEMTLEAQTLGPVFNLTGTVLHTNLGRASLPPGAIEAMARVSGGASNLECVHMAAPDRSQQPSWNHIDTGHSTPFETAS